jgi:SAM-dependent methyltransferase
LTELRGKKILEAGSGAGRFTEVLLKYGAHVYSFDFSGAVEANFNNNMPNDDLTIFQDDIREIPFENDFFDISLCLGVLQHTPNTFDSIKELNRVLKKGGLLVIDHYKSHIGHYLSLYLVYWYLIKNLPRNIQAKVTNCLTKIFFPIHWYFRRNKIVQYILRRVSSISFYYGIFELSKDQHLEWSMLDTHDKNTDHYKRHYSTKKFKKLLDQNFNFTSYKIYERGNGLECIAVK